jgi:hypothetical protein
VFAALTLALALGFSVVAPAAPNAKPAATAASSLPAVPQPTAAAEPVPPHPEIRDAIESLRRAKAHMLMAAHDYHGHRDDAIRATDEAIRQLEICMRFE